MEPLDWDWDDNGRRGPTRWRLGRHEWLLPLARQAVAGQPDWLEWRAGRSETVGKRRIARQKDLRDRAQRLRDQIEATRCELVTEALAYIGPVLRDAEVEQREPAIREEEFPLVRSQVLTIIDGLLEDADPDFNDRDIDRLSEAVCYLLLNGITPSNADAFLDGRSVKGCARRLGDLRRYYEGKALADSLADLGQ